MYGMINNAIETMVTEHYDVATWERIKAHAALDTEVYISNQGYPDSDTYALVTAASEVLQLPAEEILEAFGQHWVLRTATEQYGPLLDTAGNSIQEFLCNLPNFHAHVILTLPNLEPPEFRVAQVTDSSLELHYRSHRPGLNAFVIGLLKGLGTRFDTPVDATLQDTQSVNGSHESTFLVCW